ncbi:regulatory protein RecX [Candidatus Pacearchaeota archaeon]|nr:regulatory protein RecX [Candidatus Pacearchaeota archaeon]
MESTYDKIWKSALNTVQRRMISRHDLLRKLLGKFPNDEGDILKTLDEMERVMLLDDKRYTELLINHLIQRPIGRLKIRLETRKRGLDNDLVDSALMNSEYNEKESCQKAMDVKLETLKEDDPRKKKQKLMNFLRNRGFADTIIYSVLRR